MAYPYTQGPVAETPLNAQSVVMMPGNQLSTSGGPVEDKTANWRIHIQNVEVMYKRVTQYKTEDGTVDFNYLECSYIIEASREHIYANASGGNLYQMHQLDLQSNHASGGLGTSGVVRTTIAGVIRREAMTGDVEARTRGTGNVISGKFPYSYDPVLDTSTTANGTVFDICLAAKATCPEFELSLLDI